MLHLIRYAQWAVQTTEFRWSHMYNNPHYLLWLPGLAYQSGDASRYYGAYRSGLALGGLDEAAMDRSGALRRILDRFASRACVAAAIEVVGYAADTYGQTLYAGNVSGVVGLLGGRLAFAIGLAIDASSRDLGAMARDVGVVLTGWLPGVGPIVARMSAGYATAQCVL